MDKDRRAGYGNIRTSRNDFNYKKKYSSDESRRAIREADASPARRYRSASVSPGREAAWGSTERLRAAPPPRRTAAGTRRVDSTNPRIRRSYEPPVRKKTAAEIEAERRKRIAAERRRRKVRNARIRSGAIFVLCIAAAAVLLFMTPVFDIRQIELQGNNMVPKAEIGDKIGNLIGENIFKANKNEIRSRMLEISKISDVTVKKKMIPPSITLEITESMPAAYLLSGNTIIVINSDLKIIDDSNEFNTDSIPSLSGVSIQSYKLNEKLKTDSEEKEEILHTLLTSFENAGILSQITYISLDDLTNIKFNYENRIEILCGSQLELARKIRMFSQAVNSPSLSTNAMGTMDLSVPGQAVYTP